MDDSTRTQLANVRATDKTAQNAAYTCLMTTTEAPVAWAYEAWDEVVTGLTAKDNRVRAISAQLLCQLAKSDPENRILNDFPTLLAVTKDERFVTARHCLQALWQVGLAGAAQKQLVLDGFAQRFHECETEKNGTLIRYDISQGLWNLYAATADEAVRERALALLETEADPKYRRKYAALWKQ